MPDYDRLDRLVYLMEKKTREEYGVDKFKKRYDFKPDAPGSKRGTITVDGEKHKVDIDHKKLTRKSARMDRKSGKIVGDEDIPRTTSTDMYSGEIALGPEYFTRIKNQKRRDGILKHEIGHKKIHSLKKRIQSTKDDDSKIQNLIKSGLRKYPGAKGRDEELDALSKIKPEIEADLYGSKASNNKNMRKGLQDSLRIRAYVKTVGGVKTANQKLNSGSDENKKRPYNKRRRQNEKLLTQKLKLNDDSYPKQKPDEQYLRSKSTEQIRLSALKNQDIQNNKMIDRNVSVLKNRKRKQPKR